jgi:hypothetical protein
MNITGAYPGQILANNFTSEPSVLLYRPLINNHSSAENILASQFLNYPPNMIWTSVSADSTWEISGLIIANMSIVMVAYNVALMEGLQEQYPILNDNYKRTRHAKRNDNEGSMNNVYMWLGNITGTVIGSTTAAPSYYTDFVAQITDSGVYGTFVKFSFADSGNHLSINGLLQVQAACPDPNVSVL